MVIGITLAGAAFFSVQTAFFRYVDHVLNLGLDRSLQGDEAADRAASWLLVQVVEVPAIFQPKREPVQRIEARCTTHDAAAPEKNGPGIHGCLSAPSRALSRLLRNRTARADADRHHARIARIGIPPCEIGIGLPVKSGRLSWESTPRR